MRNGSVRVNLSVPAKVDKVLSDLAERSGQSKASFVMEALTWYLPRLEALRARLFDPREAEKEEAQRARVEQHFLELHSSAGETVRLSPAQRLQQRATEKRRGQIVAAGSGPRQEFGKGL